MILIHERQISRTKLEYRRRSWGKQFVESQFSFALTLCQFFFHEDVIDRAVLCDRGEECFPPGCSSLAPGSFRSWGDGSSLSSCSSNSSSKGGEPYRRSFSVSPFNGRSEKIFVSCLLLRGVSFSNLFVVIVPHKRSIFFVRLTLM